MPIDENDPRRAAIAEAVSQSMGYGSYAKLVRDGAGIAVGAETVDKVIGAVLAAVAPMSWLSPRHRLLAVCPGCGQGDLAATGLTSLGYEFVVCECGTPEFPHLVEQMWHRAHMGRTGAAIAATARREALTEATTVLGRAASKGEDGAPPRQARTYAGGLRYAHRAVKDLLACAVHAEENRPGS